MSTKPSFSAEMRDTDQPNVQIWILGGKMMGGSNCYEFLDIVRDNVEEGQIHPILDMTKVRFANSTGVGVLASVFTAAKDANGAMHLVGVNGRVESILKVIKLWYVVFVHDTIEEAMANNAADSGAFGVPQRLFS